jgi:hypothetical protein
MAYLSCCHVQREGEDRMSARGGDRISAFERHCGLLLRAYPAAYRSERGEEITGTLLETTPQSRTWPRPRDIRSLVIGGLSARAAQNQCRTTAANLRIAALVGLTAYFALSAAAVPGFFLSAAGRAGFAAPFGWPQIVGAVLSAAGVLVAWVSRHRALVLIFALPAAGAFAIGGPWQYGAGSAVTHLACVAALMALAGSERPNRGWLWPIGVITVAVLLAAAGGDQAGSVWIVCLLPLAFASLVWLAIDAKPVIAVAVLLLALALPATIDDLAAGVISLGGVPLLATCSTAAALAIRRLRRQSEHPRRPTGT